MPPIRFPGQGDGPLEPEGPTTEEQRRRVEEQLAAERSMPLSSGEQDRINDFVMQLDDRLSALSTMSQQLRDNFVGIGELIDRNARMLDHTANAHKRIVDVSRDELSQQQAINDYAQARADAVERINEAEKKGADAMRERLREAGMYSGGQVRYGRGERVSESEFRQMMAGDRNDPRLRAIREELEGRLALNPGRDNAFHMGQVLGSLASGNIGGALGELVQRLPFDRFGRYTAGAEAKGADWAAKGAARGGKLGAVVGMGGRMLPALAGAALSPAAALAVLAAGKQALGAYQGTLREGLQVGMTGREAVGESLGSRLRAFGQGASPFDALTRAAAAEISRGIRSQGFTGELRAAWQDAVGDVVNMTGMSAADALETMRVATDELSMDVNEFRDSMDALGSVARDTDLTVGQLTKSMQAFQQQNVGLGGTAAAGPSGNLINALNAVLPRRSALGGRLGASLATSLPTISMQFGGLADPSQAFSPENLNRVMEQLDRLGAYLIQMKRRTFGPNVANGRFARFLITVGLGEQYFPGMDVADIEEFLNTYQKTGFARAQRQYAIEDAKAAQERGEKRGGWRGTLSGITGKVGDLLSPLDNIPGLNRIPGVDYLSPFGPAGTLGTVGLGNLSERLGTDTGAGRRAAIAKLRQQLIAMGIPATDRQRILSGLRGADSTDEFANALTRAEEQLLRVQVDFTPAAKPWLSNPGGAAAYNQYVWGGTGSQGTVRPPG